MLLIWNGWKSGTGDTRTSGKYPTWNQQHYMVDTRQQFLVLSILYPSCLGWVDKTAKKVSLLLCFGGKLVPMIRLISFFDLPKVIAQVLLTIILLVYFFNNLIRNQLSSATVTVVAAVIKDNGKLRKLFLLFDY